jgi:hypothetical protein
VPKIRNREGDQKSGGIAKKGSKEGCKGKERIGGGRERERGKESGEGRHELGEKERGYELVGYELGEGGWNGMGEKGMGWERKGNPRERVRR